MKKSMRLQSCAVIGLTVAALLGVSQNSKAAVIAIVDSGTDLKHPELAGKAWNNPGEVDDAVDNDRNGYIDDLHGWNFPDNNNRLVDQKLIGTWSPDCYKFFDIQTRALNGVATDADKAWVKEKVKDQKFIQELEAFGNHVHGTHVAGIAARDADKARIMVLRLLTNGQPNFFIQSLWNVNPSITASPSTKEKLVFFALGALASQQGKGVAPIGQYISKKGASVANCSFGSSRAAIEPMLKPLVEKILGKKLTEEELHVYSNYFLTKAGESMQKNLIDPAKKTLFVIAAGNDGSNNDVAGAVPANVKTSNAITVAATLGRAKLAVFSNYGEKMVDIAAPGVGIVSSIPGGEYMPLSGTSQAAPYVTNLAGRIFDENPKLAPADVKTILMDTVDKKPFLSKKVRSEGIANAERALYAARLSRSMSVAEAIGRSNREVGTMRSTFSEEELDDSDLTVLPLPSFIR